MESSGEVFFDKQDDTVYVSDKVMELEETKFEQPKQEDTEQRQFFVPVEKSPEPEENIVGQYKNTYILIEKEDGLEIVDQHIAEERYIYEKLMAEKILCHKCFLCLMLYQYQVRKQNL